MRFPGSFLRRSACASRWGRRIGHAHRLGLQDRGSTEAYFHSLRSRPSTRTRSRSPGLARRDTSSRPPAAYRPGRIPARVLRCGQHAGGQGPLQPGSGPNSGQSCHPQVLDRSCTWRSQQGLVARATSAVSTGRAGRFPTIRNAARASALRATLSARTSALKVALILVPRALVRCLRTVAELAQPLTWSCQTVFAMPSTCFSADSYAAIADGRPVVERDPDPSVSGQDRRSPTMMACYCEPTFDRCLRSIPDANKVRET